MSNAAPIYFDEAGETQGAVPVPVDGTDTVPVILGTAVEEIAQEVAPWTSTGITQVAMNILGGMTWASAAAIGGAAAMGTITTLTAGLAAVPLVIAGSALFISSYMMYDYENPLEILDTRRAAERMSFDDLESTHGLENVFKYRLISPSRFADVYTEKANQLPVMGIINMYEQAQSGRLNSGVEGYFIPEPINWRANLHAEMQNINAVQASERYNFARLVRHGLLSSDDASFLSGVQREVQDFTTLYNQALNRSSELFLRDKGEARRVRDQAIDRAMSQYDNHFAHAMAPGANKERELRSARGERDQAVRSAEQAFETTLSYSQRRYEEASGQAKLAFDSSVARVNNRYETWLSTF